MKNEFSRQIMLIGKANQEKLRNSSVLIAGAGGVGGYVCEALARCGVGKIIIVDNDSVDITNINRQIIATQDTLGLPKAELICRRVNTINPSAEVSPMNLFISEENADKLPLNIDYIADAVDTVSAKILLAQLAFKNGIPIISSMGTGNKLDPSRLKIADIFETDVCPLARVMRKKLRELNIHRLAVVYSDEKPLKPDYCDSSDCVSKASPPGSVSFVPPVAGFLIASKIVRELTGL